MSGVAASGPTAATVFAALADPSRRAIVERLGLGPASVSALAGPLKVTVTAVAQHLRVLEASGLVRTEKTGRVRTCRIESAGFSVLEQWIGFQRSRWAQRFDQLDALLAEDDSD